MAKKKQDIKDRMVAALRASLDRQGGLRKFVGTADVSTRFQRAVKFGQELEASGPSETEEEIEQRRERERAEADAKYKAVVDEVKEMENKIQSFITEMRQVRYLSTHILNAPVFAKDDVKFRLRIPNRTCWKLFPKLISVAVTIHMQHNLNVAFTNLSFHHCSSRR